MTLHRDREERLDDQQVWAEQYEKQGTPIRAIAAQAGMSYGTVHRALVAAGVQMRPRGGPRPRAPRLYTRQPPGGTT